MLEYIEPPTKEYFIIIIAMMYMNHFEILLRLCKSY